MLDLSENGRQITEKLLALLDAKQQQELIPYILGNTQSKSVNGKNCPCSAHTFSCSQYISECRLTEIYVGKLYFCLESRMMRVSETEIDLTAKEFASKLWKHNYRKKQKKSENDLICCMEN